MNKFIKFLTSFIIGLAFCASSTVCYAGVENENHLNISSQDRLDLIKLIYLEARGESHECKTKVTSVVFDRMNSGYWGESVNDVIYAKRQFTPSKEIKDTKIDYQNETWEDCIDAVDEIIKNGSNIPKYVLYFSAGSYFEWDGYKGYEQIDNTYFGYMYKDKALMEIPDKND